MDKLFKLDEVIEFGYQAPNALSGLEDVVAEIYHPNQTKDSNHPDVVMEEVGDTGTYRGTFIPDALGVWQVIMHLADGDGQLNKAYSVGNYNMEEVGVAVDALQTALTGLGDVAESGDVTDAQTAITNAIAALGTVAVQGDITTAITTLEAAIDALGDVAVQGDLDALQSTVTGAITTAQGVVTAAITTTEGIVTAAITAAQDVVTAAIAALDTVVDGVGTAVDGVKTVVDGIADSVASLDTPPQAF